MRLKALIRSAGIFPQTDSLSNSVEITGIQFDSRKVEPGNLFIAIEGKNYDGHAFVQEVISKGAAAIIGSKKLAIHAVPYLLTSDTRRSLAVLSAAFYGFPAKQMTVIGVTGTDGKTTTVNLIHQILSAHQVPTGMISTVSACIGGEAIDTGFHVTTPEAPTIQRLLHKMLQNGLTHVILETTSHGLAQKRVDACEFDIGVVTNITHEHLDYHQDYEGYFNAKFKLIEKLARTGEKKSGNLQTAVINHDDISYQKILERIEKLSLDTLNLIDYGLSVESTIRAINRVSTSHEMRFDLEMNKKRYPVTTSLLGEYNIYNILAAVAAVSSVIELDMNATLESIRAFPGVPGRMERINLGQNFLAFVDFAHTPNALKVTLETARKITMGRVIAVFGSAGLRDKGKRRLMAAVSARMADVTILTAEDPRTEDLDKILTEMGAEAENHGTEVNRTCFIYADRGTAIRKAVSMAREGDLVIVCGKGHEQSMCFGEIEYPWDDRIAVRAALAERLGLNGPDMPYLPTQDC